MEKKDFVILSALLSVLANEANINPCEQFGTEKMENYFKIGVTVHTQVTNKEFVDILSEEVNKYFELLNSDVDFDEEYM